MHKEEQPFTSLAVEEYKAFLKFLPRKIRILVETYKFVSEVFAGIGFSYYLREIFHLPASSVYKRSEMGCSPVQICIYRTSRCGSKRGLFFAHYLKDRLGKKLLHLSHINQEGLLFQQDDGTAFNNTQLSQEFDRASKRALEAKAIKKRIIPKDLRLQLLQEIKYRPGAHREISQEKVDKILKILPTSRRNAGRNREHSLKDLLEALLAREDFDYSRRELKRHFPVVAIAADEQRRRWEKKGIWARVLRILQS